MKTITVVPLFLLIANLVLASSAESLVGYYFREPLSKVEHILFLSDLKNIANFTQLRDSDTFYEPPQDFFLIIHENDYMIFTKSFSKEMKQLPSQENNETKEQSEKVETQEKEIQVLKLNDIPSLIRAQSREKQIKRVRVLQEDFTRDDLGMIYFQGYQYEVAPQQEIETTSLLVSKSNSASILIENQNIVNPEKRDLITSFKSSSIHIIYIASGSLCTDSSFTKSRTVDDQIGANRRLCRELIHWLMEEDPLVQQAKFQEPDDHFKIHKRRNILSLPVVPYYLEIWLLIIIFFWFLLRFIYSEHKDWIRQDKHKDKKPQNPLPSFDDYQDSKKRRKIDAKPLYSSVNEARRRKPQEVEALNGQQGEV